MQTKSLVGISIMVILGIMGVSGMAMTLDSIDVPKAVKNAFYQKYPDAQKVEWEMEAADEYEAEFKTGGVEMSANFKKDGTWVGTETEMDEDDLPQAVKDGIAATFSGYEIEEAEHCEKPNKVIAYEVELENEETDSEITVVFSSDGKLIKKEIEKEDNDDN